MSDTEKRPKRGFLRLLIVGLIVLAAILLHNLTSPHRYSMQRDGLGDHVSMVKMDRITGKTWRYGFRSHAGVIHWIEMPEL